MSESQRPERLAVSLKGFFSSLIELVHVRLELITVEARDEALRLTELLVYGALAIAFLTFGIAFVAVLAFMVSVALARHPLGWWRL